MVGLVFLLVSLFASWEIALSLVDSVMMKDGGKLRVSGRVAVK